jgi:hypothetical protein
VLRFPAEPWCVRQLATRERCPSRSHSKGYIIPSHLHESTDLHT